MQDRKIGGVSLDQVLGFVKKGDTVTLGLFGTVLLLFMPLPAALLDLLLVGSIGASLLVMLVIIYVKEPSEFTGFPTILLGLTIYRLGLNVASTKLILLKGDAEMLLNPSELL